ncbi:MAG: hypothetical protein QOH69_151 [Actinomycetota bacterium]|jgi:hypothetical protein|nr:hypothetical protein [Actinomycetota bacterium]
MPASSNKSVVRSRLSILAVAVAVLSALVFPVGAAAADPTPAPTPHRHALTMGSFFASSYAAAGARLPSGLNTALHRDLGLTGAQYLADAAAAAQAVKVVASLKSVGVDVLGSKIDGTELTVNVASAADKATVAATGATAVVGTPAVQDSGEHAFHSVTAPTPTYGGEGYFFQNAAQITEAEGNGFRCSIGFSGYGLTDPQFVTAGHCATMMAANASLITQTAPSNNGGDLTYTSTMLGTQVAGEAQYGGNLDYGIVGEGTVVTPQASIYTWGGGTGAPLASAALPIVGQTAAIVNANLCKSGSTSGWTCGSVVKVDHPVEVCPEGTAPDADCPDDVVNSIVASTCLLPGDSGGGAVIGQLAAGIDSGSDFPDTSCANSFNSTTGWTYESVFFPMVSAAGSSSVTGQVGTKWTLLTAPVVSSPAAGATISSSASMTGTLATVQSGLALSLYLDGSTTAFGSVTGAANWSIPLTSVPQGSHTYTLMETLAGNQIAVITGSFIEAVTNVPAVTFPASGATVDSNSVMTGTITSPLSNSTALLYLDGSTNAFAKVNASSGSWSISLAGISLGSHSYSVAAGAGATPGAARVTGSFTVAAVMPAGSFDSASGVPGGIQISGWSLDRSISSSTYIWVNIDGSGGGLLANVSIPWINGLFPGVGPNHGFAATLPASPGNHTVCVFGTNSISLGCKSVSVPQNAQGSFDSASGVPGGIQVSGWSLDLSTTASTYVWVNVDGRGGPILANASLPWINALFPGIGTNHGFSATLSASPGGHTVCVFGTNSISLGCKSVTVPNNAQGSFDSASGVPGGIQISGWSLDLTTTASTYVWVNIDGSGGPMLANASLPWINGLFPGVGTNHGFSGKLSASPGRHTVCVYGTNSLSLGCKTVTVPQNAQGSFDSATGVSGGIQISGWSLDLSTAASTYIWVNVDGSGGPMLANASLPWIDGLFPGEGANHGFAGTLSASPGNHTVCVYGTNSISLGCKSVTVPA